MTTALAFSEGEGTDGTGQAASGNWGLDNGLSAGLTHAHLRFSQHLEGELSSTLSYRSEAFIAPDITAMAYGLGTGGGGLYSNIGVNGSLHYQKDGFGAHLGAQVMVNQVNNLEATGLSAGLDYTNGNWSLEGSINALESPEGHRLQSQQAVRYNFNDTFSAFGYAQQEQIFNDQHGHFSNPGGQKFGLGLNAKF